MSKTRLNEFINDCIHCNGKGFNGLEPCTQCNHNQRLEEIERLIAQRDEHMRNYNDYSNADIYVHDLSDKGHIDWLYRFAKEQSERIEKLEAARWNDVLFVRKLKHIKNNALEQIDVTQSRNERLEQQNMRHHNLLESLSDTYVIAKEISKQQPGKKIIDANDILQYILRKINDELERETE